MNQLREIEQLISKEHLNLQKSKYRARSLENILNKKENLNQNIERYRKILKSYEHRISAKEWNSEVETYSAVKLRYNQCITLLDTSEVILNDGQTETIQEDDQNKFSLEGLKQPKVKIRVKTIAKIIIWYSRVKHNRILNMAMDIKTASELATLIPSYNGNVEGVKSFTDAVALVKTIIPAGQKEAAIKIILTKLSGKARNLFVAVPLEFDEIIDKIKSECSDKSNSDLAQSSLKNLKLKNIDDLQNFTKQIEFLSDKLTGAYIREEIPADVAKKMAIKLAIQTMARESYSSETKMMLKIGKFDTLKDAINVLIENVPDATQTSAILQTKNIQTRKFDTIPRNFRPNFSRDAYSNRNQSYDRTRFSRTFNNRQPNRSFNPTPNQRNRNIHFRNRDVGYNRFQNFGNHNSNRFSRVYFSNLNPQVGNVTTYQDNTFEMQTANQSVNRSIHPSQATQTYAQVVQNQQPQQTQQHFLDRRM